MNWTKIKKGKNGLFYFQLKAKNGEPLFSSEGYFSKASAKRGQKDIIKNVLLLVAKQFDS